MPSCPCNSDRPVRRGSCAHRILPAQGKRDQKLSPAAEVCLLANLGGLDWFFSRPEYDVRVPYTLASAVDRLFYYIFERPACSLVSSRLVLVGPWLSV